MRERIYKYRDGREGFLKFLTRRALEIAPAPAPKRESALGESVPFWSRNRANQHSSVGSNLNVWITGRKRQSPAPKRESRQCFTLTPLPHVRWLAVEFKFKLSLKNKKTGARYFFILPLSLYGQIAAVCRDCWPGPYISKRGLT